MNTQTFFIAAMTSALAIGCGGSLKPDEDMAEDGVTELDEEIENEDDDDGDDDGGSDDGGAVDGAGGSDGGIAPPGSDDGDDLGGGGVDGLGGGDDGGGIDGLGGGDEDEDPSLDGGLDDDEDVDFGEADGGGDIEVPGDTDGGDTDGDDTEADGGETDMDDTEDGTADGSSDEDAETDEEAAEEDVAEDEAPVTETEVEDIEVDIEDGTAAAVDKSNCSLYLDTDEDSDGDIDYEEVTSWDGDENIVLEAFKVPVDFVIDEDGTTAPGVRQALQEYAYDGDCMTFDRYTIVDWLDAAPVDKEELYNETIRRTCNEEGDLATYQYEIYDDWTDSSMIISDSFTAELAYEYDADGNVLVKDIEYYDGDGGWLYTETTTNTYAEGELDTQSIVYTEADSMDDGLYGDDTSYAVDTRDGENRPTEARWFSARGDVIRNAEWTYDEEGNILMSRVWLGSNEIIANYAYDGDGNTTEYNYFSSIDGDVTNTDETWEYDADGNILNYTFEGSDEAYGLTNAYDDTEFTRLASTKIDVDLDSIDDGAWTLTYDGVEWPWSYTAELNDYGYDETAQSEYGEYICD